MHKCSSAMKLLNWPLSLLPSQLFGIKSLILSGLAVSAVPAERPCMALEMLLIASSLTLIAVCISSRGSLQGVCNLMSDLLLQRHQVCCGGPYLLATTLCDCCCCRRSRGPPTGSSCDGAYQRSAAMSNRNLFCDAPCANANALGE